MTDQLLTTPLIQIVTADLERTFAFSEIAEEGDDPATISDTDLKARIARHLELDPRIMDNLIVTRPATHNVLVAPKPTYGNY